jgi:hypothetical protein
MDIDGNGNRHKNHYQGWVTNNPSKVTNSTVYNKQQGRSLLKWCYQCHHVEPSARSICIIGNVHCKKAIANEWIIDNRLIVNATTLYSVNGNGLYMMPVTPNITGNPEMGLVLLHPRIRIWQPPWTRKHLPQQQEPCILTSTYI